MAGNEPRQLPSPSSQQLYGVERLGLGVPPPMDSPETSRNPAGSVPFSPSLVGEPRAVRRALFPPHRDSKSSGDAREKKGSRVSNPGGKNAGRLGFEKGDMVWAKAFPYTWWPGRVERIQGSSFLVAFYGCDRVKWFPASKIFDFEEHYARTVKMVGVKLADNIALAIEELQRRAVLGLTCPCRSSAAEIGGVNADRTKDAKIAFEVKNMMDFLFDVAGCASIGKEEAVRTAKLSEQVLAYRKHVSICANSEVDDAFCPADCLKIVRAAAVPWCTGGCEIRDNPKTQVQLNGFRQFVSVHPSWVYLRIESQNEDLIAYTYGGKYKADTYQEMHWPSPRKDLLLGVWKETDYHLRYQQDEDFEVPKEHAPVGREACMVNRADFSLLDIDQSHKSPMDYQLEVLASSSTAIQAGKSCNNEKNEMQKPSRERSINKGDNVITHVGRFHIMRHANQTSGSGTKSKGKEQHLQLSSYVTKEYHGNAGFCLLGDGDFDQSQQKISYNASTLTIAKKQKLQLRGRNVEDIEPATNNYVVETSSSVDGSLLQATAMSDRRFIFHEPSSSPTYFPNEILTSSGEIHRKYNVIGTENVPSNNMKLMSSIVPGGLVVSQHTPPPNEKLTSNFKMQSIYEGDFVPRGEVETPSNNVKSISSLASTELTSLKGATKESSFKKRRCDHLAPGGSFKLNSLDPHSMRLGSFAPVQKDDKIISAKELETEKTIMLENAKYAKVSSSNESIVSCKINRDSHNLNCSSSTMLSEEKKRSFERAEYSDTSMWTKFYASPLVSTASGSSIKTLNYPGNDGRNGSPRTLHMKFPKGFNLPSKEELQKKFRVFGPLDNSKTSIFFYTDAAKVVFFNKADAVAAYRFVKKKNIFGHADVRFWFDGNEKSGSAYIDKTR